VIKSRIIKWFGHVARIGESRAIYKVLVGNLREGDKFVDPALDGRIILKMDHQEVGCGGMDCLHLDQDRDRWRALVDAVMSLRGP
jgi:hypothetical protein